MAIERFLEIGKDPQIDEDVVLGYKYPGFSERLKIGDYAIIRSGTIIYADNVIGDRFSCGHRVLIRAKCVIGNRVIILHNSTLEGRVKIGYGVKIMAHVYIPSTTEIGNMVFIGPGTTFLNDKYPMRRKAPVQGPKIEEHVTIGGGVTICPGIKIGRNSFIGAGSVVSKDVPPDTLAYGVPVRFHSLPEISDKGNLPELLLPQTDIWGAQSDETWRDENFPTI
ncbi:MAG: N-acetyltransferase [Deltaproteobacteria bacterium]|nr:N-acetyltransferase [Deltaproteobacteria bacterium]